MIPAAFLLLLLSPISTLAVRVRVEPHDAECFLAPLSSGEHFGFDYEVTAGGKLDIDVEITSPSGAVIYKEDRVNDGKAIFSAEEEGDFRICLQNRFSTVTAKVVEFSLSYEEAALDDDSLSPSLIDDAAKKEEVDRLLGQVYQLSSSLRSITREQKYMITRESTHRDTTESTNTRVTYWSTLESFMVISVSLLQVWYLRRFFEVKRRV
jgi:hypothetical protein